MDQARTAVLETFEGLTYKVQIGNKTGEDSYHLKVAVQGNIDKQRKPGADEKAEDKEKLDKEFSEKVAKLEEKLKKEKEFESWTYLVSKWTIDPLLKERHELLAEKKDEKKDEKSATEQPKADPLPPPALDPVLNPPLADPPK
jgi:hypothetical protein